MAFHPVTHCIFDMDGLLLGRCAEFIRSHSHCQALDSLCMKYGSKFTPEARLVSMGRVGIDTATTVIQHCNLPLTPETFLKELQQYSHLFEHVNYMPGALALIKHFHKEGIPQAIATSSTRTGFEIKTKDQRETFETVFEHILTAGSDPEIKRGKPHPATFLIAAQRFKHKPIENKNVLVFEDSLAGVEAALAAGMQVVWVPDLRYVENTSSHGAHLVIPSLNMFDPTLFNLPPRTAQE